MRVLIVDDSALMRKLIRRILEEEPGVEVHTARDGEDALARVAELDPDVVTLDLNMPVMDGMTCLSILMQQHPRPVVVISSLTEEGAAVTMEALALGAVDYVPKPGGTVSLNIVQVAAEIRAKVKAAARSRVRRSQGLAARLRQRRQEAEKIQPVLKPGSGGSLVLVGVSTGGPGALETLLTALPSSFPASVVVAQHMPASFTRVLAARLDKLCSVGVQEVTERAPLRPGQVYIAQGEHDIEIRRTAGGLQAVSLPANPNWPWQPSVERMVRSAIGCCPAASLVGVQLTGMGDDGARAMAELHQRGGRTIAESEESAVVYGMPRALVLLGGASVVLPIHRVADQLLQWLGPRRMPPARQEERRWA